MLCDSVGFLVGEEVGKEVGDFVGVKVGLLVGVRQSHILWEIVTGIKKSSAFASASASSLSSNDCFFSFLLM